MTKIATFPFQQKLVDNSLRIQSLAAEAQLQTSTGLKAIEYKDIAPDAQRLVSLESDAERIDEYTLVNTRVSSELQTQFTALGQVLDRLRNFTSTLSQNFGPTGDPIDLANIASITRDSLIGVFNTQHEGRFIFSGNRTDTRPVDPNFAPVIIAPSAPDITYFQGDSSRSPTQISDTLSLDFMITADNSAFEQALRGVNLMVSNAADPASKVESLDLINNAIDEFASLYERTSNFATLAEEQKERHVDDKSNLDEAISNIINVDFTETQVRFTNLQVQLEASFSTMTRIINLKLFDFIR